MLASSKLANLVPILVLVSFPPGCGPGLNNGSGSGNNRGDDVDTNTSFDTETTNVDLYFDDDSTNAGNFGTYGDPWPTTELTFAFTDRSNDLSDGSVQRAMREAFDVWILGCDALVFEESSELDADILFGWYEGDHGDGSPFDGGGQDGTNTLAHAFSPTGSLDGDLHFDDYEEWVDSENPGPGEIDVVTVAIHELGHSLGLGHSDDPNAIMYPKYSGVYRQLGSDDVDGIISLYTCEADCDKDEDGYASEECGGSDCDDTRDYVNPGMEEDCNTNGDDNCNDITNEEDAENCDLYYYDWDEDGYGKDQSKCLCQPDGLYTSSIDTDCDDNNADINPGAPELCNDLVDNDCDNDSDCNDGDCQGEIECLVAVNLTLRVVGDSYVNESSPNTNYNGENLITEIKRLGADHYQKTIPLDFNLDEKLVDYSPDYYFVSEAIVYFYVRDIQGISSVEVVISPIVTSWNEATVTWDINESFGIDIRSGSGEVYDIISAGGWFSMDLTNPSQKVFTGAYPVHNGYVVHLDDYPPYSGDAYEVTLYSKEVYPTRAAYLEVTLEPY